MEGRSASPEALAKGRQALIEAHSKAADARGTGKHAVFGGRGTVLLEELRAQFGFETVHVDAVPKKDYWNAKNYTSDAATRKSGLVPSRADLVTGADTGQPIDVRVGVDRFVKLGRKMSPESQKLWEQLKNVEYAVGIADSGYHVRDLGRPRLRSPLGQGAEERKTDGLGAGRDVLQELGLGRDRRAAAILK